MINPTSRILLAAAAILIIAAAPSARADSSIFGGIGFPTGELADATTSGWIIGGHATGNVSSIIDVGGYISYTDFVVDTTAPGAGAQFGPSLGAWEFDVLGQIDIFFLKGVLGLGLANYSGQDENGDSKRKSGFTWQLGVAAQWSFLEGRLVYHQISTDGTSPGWIGLTVGILF